MTENEKYLPHEAADWVTAPFARFLKIEAAAAGYIGGRYGKVSGGARHSRAQRHCVESAQLRSSAAWRSRDWPMKWRGLRRSQNVEDRRGQGAPRRAGLRLPFGGGIGLILLLVLAWFLGGPELVLNVLTGADDPATLVRP